MNLFRNLKNKFKYKEHSRSVSKFLREHYTLEVKSVQGPLLDNEDTEQLFYLVTFVKECPENKITLKVDRDTKEVSEVERL